MAPKTPRELKEQVERENAEPPPDDEDRTAEGLTVPRPARADFLKNLEKASAPEPDALNT